MCINHLPFQLNQLEIGTNSTTYEPDMGAAFGILFFAVICILSFLYINKKLEECRARAQSGFNNFR